MNSDMARHSLGMTLEREIDSARALARVLGDENAAIATRDLPLLQQAVADKQALLQQLEEQNGERTRLLESNGYSGDRDGMNGCLKWCDNTGMLTRTWQQLLAIAENCRDQNRINHRLMELGNRHIHHALCLLRGEEPGQDLYGPGGNNLAEHASRSLATV